MRDFLTACWALRYFLGGIVLFWVGWIPAAMIYRDLQERRWDRQAEARVRDWFAHVDAAVALTEPTPIYDDLAAAQLRAELEDPSLVQRWLS